MLKRLIVAALVLLIPWVAAAGLPLDTARLGVEKILKVAGDQTLSDKQSVKEEKIREIISEFFDFQILSRMALGRNWKKFSPDQQKEFTMLFRALLEQVYMDRILAYSDEEVEFTKETTLSKKKAEVRSKIITNTAEIPIYYRMVYRGDRWKTYDVVIEGVSLVKNYRSQFNELMNRKSPEDLLAHLRKKTRQ
jgi:phospholipid transport system substrate-binding protein